MRRAFIATALAVGLAGPALADSDHDYQEPSSSHDFGYDGYTPRSHGGRWFRRDAYAYEPYAYRYGYADEGRGYDRYRNSRRGYDDRYDRAWREAPLIDWRELRARLRWAFGR